MIYNFFLFFQFKFPLAGDRPSLSSAHSNSFLTSTQPCLLHWVPSVYHVWCKLLQFEDHYLTMLSVESSWINSSPASEKFCKILQVSKHYRRLLVLWKGTCAPKAQKPVTLPQNPTFTKVWWHWRECFKAIKKSASNLRRKKWGHF